MKEIMTFFWYNVTLLLGLLLLFQVFNFLFFKIIHLDFMVVCMGFGCGPMVLLTRFIAPFILAILSYAAIKNDVIPVIVQGGTWIRVTYAVYALSIFMGLYVMFDFYSG